MSTSQRRRRSRPPLRRLFLVAAAAALVVVSVSAHGDHNPADPHLDRAEINVAQAERMRENIQRQMRGEPPLPEAAVQVVLERPQGIAKEEEQTEAAVPEKQAEKEDEAKVEELTPAFAPADAKPAVTEEPSVDACASHDLALDELKTFPTSGVQIPRQVFLQLASDSGPGHDTLFGRYIEMLRRALWRKGYTDSRMPGQGEIGGSDPRVKKNKGKKIDEHEVRVKAVKILKLLQKATDDGCAEAWGTRGQLALYPPPPLQQNLVTAFNAYSEHARLTGNATSHYIVGFFHATGYGGVTDIAPGKALLHYTFAALQGHPAAEHSLAYKYWAGIGVSEDDCMTALDWYERGAERVYNYFTSGPPGGRTLPPTNTRLSDQSGGVYGDGASWASAGHNSRRAAIDAAKARAGGETWDDIMEYYQYHANHDEHEYSFLLGRAYYLGSLYQAYGGLASGAEGVGAVTQSFDKAHRYFMAVVRQVWPSEERGHLGRHKLKNGKEIELDNRLARDAMYSAMFLGRMYLRGEGKPGKPDFRKARIFLERAVEIGVEKESHNMLGIIYRDGLGVTPDINKAIQYFKTAAGADLPEAQINLAKLHLAQSEVHPASGLLSSAVRLGSPFEAFYLLGKIYAASARQQLAAGIRPETCTAAVAHLKIVVERGTWKDDIVSDADRAWERGESDKAILGWWMANERGYESAQNNLAYVLDQDTPLYSLPWRKTYPDEVTGKMALNFWIRSAAQDNVDALVKVGDYLYKGIGHGGQPQYEEAAGYYQSAAERQTSAIAFFNLGHMYENGLGVPQDWHLAKRNFDLALETNDEASFPVTLALIWLHARSFWSTLTGGPQKSLSLFSAPGATTRGEEDAWYVLSLAKTLRRALGGDGAALEQAGAAAGGDKGAAAGRVDNDARAEPDFDEGDWVGLESATGGDRYHDDEDDDDDGFSTESWFETILLVALCVAVALLSWIRARWTQQAEARRRAEAAAAGGGEVVAAPPPVAPPQFPPDPPAPMWL